MDRTTTIAARTLRKSTAMSVVEQLVSEQRPHMSYQIQRGRLHWIVFAVRVEDRS